MIESFAFLLCIGVFLYLGARLLHAQLLRVRKPPALRPGHPRSMPAFRTLISGIEMQMAPTLALAASATLVLGVYLVCVQAFPEQPAFAALAAGAALVTAAMGFADILSWRAERFESKLVESIDLMNTALQGGLPPRQALLVACDACDGAVKDELLEIIQRMDLGLSVDQSVRRMSNRYNSEGVRLFTQALVAKWHSGGDFAALLHAVNGLIRERIKQRLVVSGQLSGARYAAIFSGLLPYTLVPLFLWREPGWFSSLLNHPNGTNFLLTAALMQVAGYFWLRQVLRVKL